MANAVMWSARCISITAYPTVRHTAATERGLFNYSAIFAGPGPGNPSRLVKPQKATESEIEPTQDDLVSA
jgi:hypothetical protein